VVTVQQLHFVLATLPILKKNIHNYKSYIYPSVQWCILPILFDFMTIKHLHKLLINSIFISSVLNSNTRDMW